MKNLKPSVLPEGAVIDDERHGEFIKRSDGVWEELDSNYMGDRERVTDVGYEAFTASGKTRDEWYARYDLPHRESADDYFTNYKVIAIPPWFVYVGDAESIHGDWLNSLNSYVDGALQHNCKGYNCEHGS